MALIQQSIFLCHEYRCRKEKTTIESNKTRWANKEEAYQFAKNAVAKGNLGMSYLACCDYLGWDVSIRRMILAKHKRKAHTHE